MAGNGRGFTAGNPNAPQGSQVAFLQDHGTTSQTVTLAAGSFAVSFIGAGSHTLKFEGLNPLGGDNTAFLDGTQLYPA